MPFASRPLQLSSCANLRQAHEKPSASAVLHSKYSQGFKLSASTRTPFSLAGAKHRTLQVLIGCVSWGSLLLVAQTPVRAQQPVETGDAPSIEATLIKDMHRCLLGEPISDSWRHPRRIDGHLRGNGRSANHGRMARAIQTCVAPSERIGTSQLNARQWWAAIEELERSPEGHRYEEIGGEYESWSGLSEALVVWKTQQRDHPAARMLRRELLLFAIAARPLEERSKWRALYRGYGRRVAGLRKLPWAWSLTVDSYFYAKILDLPIQREPVRRPVEVEVAEALAPLVRAVLAEDLPLLRQVALAPSTLRDRLPQLRALAKDLRAIQPYLVVRHIPSSNTFSALLGPLRGRNTAPTRAVLTLGPLLSETETSYPFLDQQNRPRSRVRGGQEIKAGGGKIVQTEGGTRMYQSWNRGPDVATIELPTWTPLDAKETPCDTLGIWLFPEREPSLWLGAACSANLI